MRSMVEGALQCPARGAVPPRKHAVPLPTAGTDAIRHAARRLVATHRFGDRGRMDAASARIYRGARARVAELVDAHDSKSCSARSGGSIPSTGTTRCSQMFVVV